MQRAGTKEPKSETSPDEDGEAALLKPAVGVGEACFAEPLELRLDGRAAVLPIAIERLGDLLLGGAETANLGQPALLVEDFER